MNVEQRALLRVSLEASQDPYCDSSVIFACIDQIKTLLLELPASEPSKDVVVSVLILLYTHHTIDDAEEPLSEIDYKMFYDVVGSVEKKLERFEIDKGFYGLILKAVMMFYIEMPSTTKALFPTYDLMLSDLEEKYVSMDEVIFKPTAISLTPGAIIPTAQSQQIFLDKLGHYLRALSFYGNRFDEAHQRASKELREIASIFEVIPDRPVRERFGLVLQSIQQKIFAQMMKINPTNHLESLLEKKHVFYNPLHVTATFLMYLQNQPTDLDRFSILERMALFRWLNFEINHIKPLLIYSEEFLIPEMESSDSLLPLPLCVYSNNKGLCELMHQFVRESYNHLASLIGVNTIDFATEEITHTPFLLLPLSASEIKYVEDLFQYLDARLDKLVDLASKKIVPPCSVTHRTDYIDRVLGFMFSEQIEKIELFFLLPPTSPSAARIVITEATRLQPFFSKAVHPDQILVQFILAKWVIRLINYFINVGEAELNKRFDLGDCIGDTLEQRMEAQFTFYKKQYNQRATQLGFTEYVSFPFDPKRKYKILLPSRHELFQILLRYHQDSDALSLLMTPSVPNEKTPMHIVASLSSNGINYMQLLNGLLAVIERGQIAQVAHILLMKDKNSQLSGHLMIEHQHARHMSKYFKLLSILLSQGYDSVVCRILKTQDKQGNTLGHTFALSKQSIIAGFIEYLLVLNQLPQHEQKQIRGLMNTAGKTAWEALYLNPHLPMSALLKKILTIPKTTGFQFKCLSKTTYKKDLLLTEDFDLLKAVDMDGRTIFHFIADLREHRLMQLHLSRWHEFAKKEPGQIIDLLKVTHPTEGSIGYRILKSLDNESILYFTRLLFILIKKGFETHVDEILNATAPTLKSLNQMLAEKANPEIQADYQILNQPLLRAIIKGDSVAQIAMIVDSLPADEALMKKALLLAAIQGAGRICLYLVGKGVNIHAQDSDGNTALHLALKHGKIKTAIALKKKIKELGKDEIVLNKSGRPADVDVALGEHEAFFRQYEILERAPSLPSTPPRTPSSCSSGLSTLTASIPEPSPAKSSSSPPTAKVCQPKPLRSNGHLEALKQAVIDDQARIKALYDQKDRAEGRDEIGGLFKKAQAAMRRIEANVKEIADKFGKVVNLNETPIQYRLLEKMALSLIARVQDDKAKKPERAVAVDPRPDQKRPLIPPSTVTKLATHPSETRLLGSYFPEASAAGAGSGQPEIPHITSIRFTAMGIEDMLKDLAKPTDISPTFTNAGLLYELFRLFELLNQLVGASAHINYVRQHLAHDHSVHLALSDDHPRARILYNLAGAYKPEAICRYASILLSEKGAAFDDAPVNAYFDALAIPEESRLDFKDRRDFLSVLSSMEFAIEILNHFYARLNPGIGKDAFTVFRGSPVLFSATKMAVLILHNTLNECAAYPRIRADIQEKIGISEVELLKIASDIRLIRNKASHFGVTFIHGDSGIKTIYEVNPNDIYRLQEGVERLGSYIKYRSSTKCSAAPTGLRGGAVFFTPAPVAGDPGVPGVSGTSVLYDDKPRM